ncbi:MAG: CBS domain-containing protein [Thermotogota bacterium]|nr:CBS domain-containing protein [Thermotogota bacterium]
MNQNVFKMKKDRTMWQAKELMRIRKISGVPIVDDSNILIGLVSIEDIIVALENKTIKDKIESHMTKKVVTLSPKENLESVIRKFERYPYGRFPVVTEEKELVGIVTKKDVLRSILERFRMIYVHDERRTKTLERFIEIQEKSLITGEYVKKGHADFAFLINYTDVDMAGMGAAKLKSFLSKKIGDDKLARRISITAYEAEVNVVIHSSSEGFIYCWINEDVIRVRIEDHGKGIENVELALKEGYTTAPDHIRELGFGAGMGLPNMRRYSDKMVVMSEAGKGVVVEMIFYRNGEE